MRSVLVNSLYKIPHQYNIKSFFAFASIIGMHYRPFSIRAHVRGKIDFTHLKTSSDMLPISVGQAYHEGEKFLATGELVNDHFKETKIVLADTLKRHDIDESDPNYQNKVNALLKEGDEWLDRNKAALQAIKNVEIKRWDYYLTHPGFEEKKDEIDRLYTTDFSFKQAVDNSANQFLKRKYNINIANTSEKNHPKTKSCIAYIKEECAVLLLWFDIEQQCSYLLYPNKLNPAMYNLMQRKTSHLETPLLKPLLIDFKEVKKKDVGNLTTQEAFDYIKDIHLDKDVLEKFCRKYFNASISTYHEIASPNEANKFLIKTLLGLSSFLKEVNTDSNDKHTCNIMHKKTIGVLGDDSKKQHYRQK